MIAAPVRLLAGVLGALTLAVVLEWTFPNGTGGAVPDTSLSLMDASPKAPLIRPAIHNWATTTLARPLFNVSRRPPPVASRPDHDAAPDKARLSGIMIGRFGRWAIFATVGDGKPLVLAEGAQVNDSTIRRIDPDRVLLANGVTALLPQSSGKNRVATTYIPPTEREDRNHADPTVANANPPIASFPIARMAPLPPLPPQVLEPSQPSTDGHRALAVSIFHGPIIANRRE